jgi:DNA-binding SARP family transcriptional activator/Tfp pilus assembly protein PilF
MSTSLASRRDPDTTAALDRAEACLYVGEAHRAIELTNEMLGSAKGLEPDARARCLLIRASALRLRGFLDEALEDASAALSAIHPETSEPRLVIQAHKQVGIPLAMRGDLPEAIRHFETAIRYCSRAADLNLEADIHDSLGVAYARSGRFAEARVHYQRAATAYEKGGRHAELATLHNNVGRLHHELGEYSLAIEAFEKSIAIARQFRSFRTESMALVNVGDARRETGDLNAALTAYQEAVQTATRAQEPRVNCCANIGIGVTYRLMRHHDKAQFHLLQAIYEADRLQLGWELAEARLEAGILALADGRAEDGEALLRASLKGFEHLGAGHGMARALLYIAGTSRNTRRRREMAAALRKIDAIRGDVTIDRRLITAAEANRDALRTVEPPARHDGLLASLRRSVSYAGEAPKARPGQVAEGTGKLVQAYTLGSCRVLIDGYEVPPSTWESRKAQELFVLLLCRRGGKTCEELLDLLWSEEDASPGRRVIHNSVYRVRRALFKDSVLLVDGLYRINPAGRFWLDVDDFRRISNDAAKCPAANTQQRLALLTEANQLFRGEFLPGIYSEWVVDTRRQIELQYLANLCALLSIHAGAGNVAEARHAIDSILEIDPTNSLAAAHAAALRIRPT